MSIETLAYEEGYKAGLEAGSEKLSTLKEYTDLQANDEALWTLPMGAYEAYLKQELRTLVYLIEDATIEQIDEEIKKLHERLS